MTNTKVAYLDCYDSKWRKQFKLTGSRVWFRTSSSMSQTPNTMTARVYGLSEYEVKNAVENAHTVGLIAGNGEQSGLIGMGQVITARAVKSSEGDFLEIISVDGDEFFTTPVKRTISSGVSLGSLVEDLVRESGKAAGIGQISPLAMDVALPRGFAVLGTPVQAIRNVAKKINAAFYLNQGLVYLVRPDEMVGHSVKVPFGKIIKEPVVDGYYVSFSCDIDSGIRVGNSVEIELSGTMGHLYRVLSIQTEGDTKSALWRMSIEGMEQAESGFTQEAVTDNVWR